MEAVTKWRRPESALAALQGHLKDIATDKTEAIMACVHTLQAKAYKKAQAEFNARVHMEVERAVKERLESFHGYMLSKCEDEGVEKSSTSTTTTDVAQMFQEYTGVSGSKRPAEDSVLPTIKKPKESRGEKRIEGRDSFRKMTCPVEKLKYLVSIYNDNHGEYNNEDRQFLMRVRPAVICYTQCCNKDATAFKGKYGVDTKKGWTFHVGKIKGCTTCNPKM